MKVKYYIALPILISGLGGLLLAMGLRMMSERYEAELGIVNRESLEMNHLTRLEDNCRQWFVMSDIIFGSGQTYLTDGALGQADVIRGLLRDLVKEPLASRHAGRLDRLDELVERNATRLTKSLSLSEDERDDRLNDLLAVFDRDALSMIQVLEELRSDMRSALGQRTSALTTMRGTLQLKAIICTLAYVLLVGLVWRMIVTRLVRPLHELTRAASEASRHGHSLPVREHGPWEVRQLNHSARLFAESLEKKVEEAREANQGLSREIDERRHMEISLRKSEERFRGIFERCNDAVFLVDMETEQFIDMNPRACELVEYTKEELLNLPASTLHREELPAFREFCEHVMQNQFGRTDELTCHSKTGRRVPAEISASVYTSAGGHKCLLAIVRDISERKRNERERERMHAQLVKHATELEHHKKMLESEIVQRRTAQDQLRHKALHDTLTDLPNRELLRERVERCIARAAEDETYCYGVLFLDIDNFKMINDSMGHNIGDELLMRTADRLIGHLERTHARFDDYTAARLGGDEFVVLLEGLKQRADADEIAEAINDQMTQPFELEGQHLVITASIGIALAEGVCKTADELLRDADTAMYRAKLAGKARHAVFDEAMHADVSERLKLENQLRRAVDREEFVVHYQPIISLSACRIEAFEALIRWDSPDRGMVPPGLFIEVAEELGVIVPIGKWVLEQACFQAMRWNEGRCPDQLISVSVNVAKRQLLEPDYVDQVRQTLREAGLDPRLLKLEVTESAMMHDTATCVRVLQEIRKLGVMIAMDDFGTGQSSLSCLHQFPIDLLKIDRSFVSTMSANREYAAIVHAIVTLAQNLGMKVIAEGIELEEQMAEVLALNCDYGQGFLFSRPVPADEAIALVNEAIRIRAA